MVEAKFVTISTIMSLVTPKSVIAVGTVLPSLAAIAVGLRFYIRRSRTTSIGVDDWLILFALVR